MVHKPVLETRPQWGITVRLWANDRHLDVMEREPADTGEEIDWAIENAGGRRISYDTWQFKNRRAAEEFIMLFTLRWS